MKEILREKLLTTGAIAVGFTKAGEIDLKTHEEYVNWIREGRHGKMAYLERHIPLRFHTDNLLQGANSVISLAYGYVPPEWRSPELPYIAAYAYGQDYHVAIRNILKPVVKDFEKKYGGKWRICIDSAPMAERYWAVKSGIGKRGINGSVTVKDKGSLCFLTQILTTLEFPPDNQSDDSFNACGGCGLCVARCPGKAILGDGTIDARRCINYLTIEKKGEFTKEEKEILNSGSRHLYGCDICLRVCPHNRQLNPTATTEFFLNDEIRHLTAEDILKMTELEFQTIFSTSPLLYASYPKLLRNAATIQKK